MFACLFIADTGITALADGPDAEHCRRILSEIIKKLTLVIVDYFNRASNFICADVAPQQGGVECTPEREAQCLSLLQLGCTSVVTPCTGEIRKFFERRQWLSTVWQPRNLPRRLLPGYAAAMRIDKYSTFAVETWQKFLGQTYVEKRRRHCHAALVGTGQFVYLWTTPIFNSLTVAARGSGLARN